MKYVYTLILTPLLVLNIALPASAQQVRERITEQATAVAQERQTRAVVSIDERAERIKSQSEQRQVNLRLNICRQRESRINNNISNVVRATNRIKNHIDLTHGRVDRYYNRLNLNIDNYEELSTAIREARLNAERSLIVLQQFNLVAGCDNPNLARQLYQFRLASLDVREALKDYRQSVVDLIRAIRGNRAVDRSTQSQDSSNVVRESNNRTSEEQ